MKKCNVGGADKWIRIILGIVIIILGFKYSSWWGLLGVVILLTGVSGQCCLYRAMKISTCKNHPAEDDNNQPKMEERPAPSPQVEMPETEEPMKQDSVQSPDDQGNMPG